MHLATPGFIFLFSEDKPLYVPAGSLLNPSLIPKTEAFFRAFHQHDGMPDILAGDSVNGPKFTDLLGDYGRFVNGCLISEAKRIHDKMSDLLKGDLGKIGFGSLTNPDEETLHYFSKLVSAARYIIDRKNDLANACKNITSQLQLPRGTPQPNSPLDNFMNTLNNCKANSNLTTKLEKFNGRLEDLKSTIEGRTAEQRHSESAQYSRTNNYVAILSLLAAVTTNYFPSGAMGGSSSSALIFGMIALIAQGPRILSWLNNNKATSER